MHQVELQTREVELADLRKDEWNEWIAYFYADNVLKLVHLKGKDVYEIPNVQQFVFLTIGKQSCLVVLQIDKTFTTFSFYEYVSNRRFEHLNDLQG